MKVGFGVTVLSRGLAAGGVDGIGTYTRELAGALRRHPEITLTPISFGMPAQGILPQTSGVRLPPYPPMALASACLTLPFASHAKLKTDLFHATDHLIPRLPNIPVLATLMDAIPLSHPEWIRSRHWALKCWLWRRAAKWADHIVTISEYSKAEIVTHFGIPADQISVIPLGVNPCFFERIDAIFRHALLEKLHLPSQFFLFVGTLQPRKNVERVVEAHARLPLAMQKDTPLVIVGREGWGVEVLLKKLASSDTHDTVRWLKYLPELETRALMQSATALVFPSLCEGFGLPVAEAFASRLPVITASTTSLPEVAADAALLVNPTDTEAIAAAMQQIADDPTLALQLQEKGHARACTLTWARCAEKTAALYKQLV